MLSADAKTIVVQTQNFVDALRSGKPAKKIITVGKVLHRTLERKDLYGQMDHDGPQICDARAQQFCDVIKGSAVEVAQIVLKIRPGFIEHGQQLFFLEYGIECLVDLISGKKP